MKVFIKENTFIPRDKGLDFGWGNGYVLIPEGHVLHGVDYDYIRVDVHGGLTYSNLVTPELIKSWDLPEDSLGYWCVGFDTAHLDDSLIRWPKDKVYKETVRLMKQISDYKAYKEIKEL